MAKQVAIGIGVSKVGGLRLLSGVESGVDEFLRWALSQDFVVHSFTDADKPVVASDVKGCVATLVESRDVDKLFIYFAGHGLSVDLVEDIWLLSQARDDADEAINVARSADFARRCGIAHVAFFSDACRTPPTAFQLGTQGVTIFPNRFPREGVQVEVDRFFAARSGDPAFERVSDDVAVKAFGIFSRSLMRALEGRAPEVLSRIDNGKQQYAVEARPLRRYLDRDVRLESYRQLALEQTPDCRAESAWSPNVLSWLPGPAEPQASPPPPERGGMVLDHGGPTWSRREAAHDDVLARLDEQRASQAEEAASAVQDLIGQVDTRPGLTVIGGTVDRALITGGRVDITLEHTGWHVSGLEGEPATALIEARVDDGPRIWLATALFPDLSATAVLGSRGVEQLVYVPSDVDEKSAARTRWSTLTALLRFEAGLFDPDDPEVRAAVDERFDPVVAVLVALEYARRGRHESVVGLLDHFEANRRVVPYDLLLVSGKDWDDLHVPVAPNFPMTTRGWLLAETASVGEEAFTAARRYLFPSLWTTFRNAPTAVMRALVGQVEAEVAEHVHA